MLLAHLLEEVVTAVAAPPHLGIRREAFQDGVKPPGRGWKRGQFTDAPVDVGIPDNEISQGRWPAVAFVKPGGVVESGNLFGFLADDEEPLAALGHETQRVNDESVNGVAEAVKREEGVAEVVAVMRGEKPGDVL